METPQNGNTNIWENGETVTVSPGVYSEYIIKIFIFECPIHGDEVISYCERAFDPINLSRWKKIESRKLPLGSVELDFVRKHGHF